MSDAPITAPAAAPTSTPEAPKVEPAAAPQAAAPQEPAFLRERLERERRATLKQLGIKVSKSEDPAAAIQKLKEKTEARKEERRQLKARVAELEGEIAKTAHSIAAVKVHAESSLMKLDDKQREAVKKVAGDDPSKILETISLFEMSGTFQQAAPAAAAAPPVAATVTPPATTVPANGAPAPASAAGVDIKAQYKALKQSADPLDQFKAQMLAHEHAREILGG